MKTFPILVLTFVICIPCTFAQTDFRPGFVVTVENDTIFGEVDYRSNANNYQNCRFKKDNNITEYDARQLTGYGYTSDKYYTSGVVDVSFVEVLVKGELSLYKYAAVYFVRKNGSELHQLETKEVEANIGGKAGLKKDSRWKGIILYLTSDCPPGAAAIKTLNLDERDLTRLTISYNKCKGSDFIVYKESKPWTKLDVGVMVGLAKSTIRKDSPGQFPYFNDSYTSLNPSIGLVLGVSSPRLAERMGIQSEVHFTKSSYSSSIVVDNPTNTAYYDTYISLATLSIPLSFRYTFPGKTYSIQLLAGFNFDYHIKSDAKAFSEFVSDNGDVTSKNQISEFQIEQHQTGYWGGLGIIRSFEKFKTGLHIRYFQMSNLGATNRLNAETDKLSIAIMLSK